MMTMIGGIGHTLRYLALDSVPNAFLVATGIATFIVLLGRWAIGWIRTKYMDTPFLHAEFHVVVSGVLVFIAGILIGSA